MQMLMAALLGWLYSMIGRSEVGEWVERVHGLLYFFRKCCHLVLIVFVAHKHGMLFVLYTTFICYIDLRTIIYIRTQ
jgi:hypothetical protein